MLRPLLEQAADPIHQYNTGASSLLPQVPIQIVQHKKDEEKMQVSPSLTLFKQDVSNQLNKLLNYCFEQNLLNNNESEMFMDVQSFVQDKDSKSSISSNHLKLLCNFILVLKI